jgi:hypothetical protein
MVENWRKRGNLEKFSQDKQKHNKTLIKERSSAISSENMQARGIERIGVEKNANLDFYIIIILY